jgi:hypothetical protein
MSKMMAAMGRALGALVLSVALGAPAAGAEGQGACAVLDSPFGLDEIVAKALAEEPGTPLKAGFSVKRDAAGERVTLFKVKVKKDAGGRALLFYDTVTGDRVLPVQPTLSLLEAYDLAVAAVEAEVGAPGAVVLKGSLRRRLFTPHYGFALADPAQILTFARVDAVSGEVRLGDGEDLVEHAVKKRLKRKIQRKRRVRRLISGDPICEEIDPEDDAEDEELLDQ